MAERHPSLGVIVVNFNAGDLLVDCVRSLLSSAVEATVLVVDNASSDQSTGSLEAAFGDDSRLCLVRNPENVGFSRAVNQAAKSLDAEFLLILNPDCLLREHALERLLEAVDKDAAAGLAGPLVRDGDGAIEPACLRRLPLPWDSFVTASGLWRLGRWIPSLRGVWVDPSAHLSEVISAEATSGACMLVRRAAFAEAGGLDEGYRLHFEDLDLMCRLQEAGWRCLFVPQAEAVHLKGVSSRGRTVWVHWQKHRGMIRFHRKCLAQRYAFPVNALVFVGTWVHFLLSTPFAWLRR